MGLPTEQSRSLGRPILVHRVLCELVAVRVRRIKVGGPEADIADDFFIADRFDMPIGELAVDQAGMPGRDLLHGVRGAQCCISPAPFCIADILPIAFVLAALVVQKRRVPIGWVCIQIGRHRRAAVVVHIGTSAIVCGIDNHDRAGRAGDFRQGNNMGWCAVCGIAACRAEPRIVMAVAVLAAITDTITPGAGSIVGAGVSRILSIIAYPRVWGIRALEDIIAFDKRLEHTDPKGFVICTASDSPIGGRAAILPFQWIAARYFVAVGIAVGVEHLIRVLRVLNRRRSHLF